MAAKKLAKPFPKAGVRDTDPLLSWNGVFLVWLLATPLLVATGTLAYQKNPAPFRTAYGWSQTAMAKGQKAYGDYQKSQAAQKADLAKKEKAAAAAAAAASASAGYSY